MRVPVARGARRQVFERAVNRSGEGVVALTAAVPRPAPVRGRAHALVDRVIGGFSLVPIAPVLDVRGFGWTRELRDNWRAIREEAHVAALTRDPRAAFMLWRRGDRVEANAARCPATAAAVATIPGLDSAGFAILPPGAHVPAHRGATRGLLTCHLGLIVPRDGDVRMRVGDRIVRWAEGETLVFDDTYDHEAWNDTGGTRVVLRVRVRRPLRQPGRWIADTVLRLRSALHR
jgi:beta-hydroxylase